MQTSIQLTPIIPPRVEDVRIYFSQKGMTDAEAESFFLFYEKKSWTGKKGNFLKSWKNIAYQWIAGILQEEPWRFNKKIH